MVGLLKLLPGPQPLSVRYGATAAMVLVTFALRLGIEDVPGAYGFILFIPAIVAAALLFDRGSGFLALVLSLALIAASLPWLGQAEVHVAALASFLVVGGGLVLISEGLHRALERALEAERQKDLLLQEMSHRIKNKFAMIVSIIGLQAREVPPELRSVLAGIESRVRVIASVHDHLQLSRHDGQVDMRAYIGELCHSLAQALGHLRPISVSVAVDAIDLPADRALPTGLIINELITNAFKYAFPDDRAGCIEVRLVQGTSGLELTVTDDGVGCDAQSRSGLGRKLVTVLAAQLGGSVAWEPATTGCRVTATFPL